MRIAAFSDASLQEDLSALIPAHFERRNFRGSQLCELLVLPIYRVGQLLVMQRLLLMARDRGPPQHSRQSTMLICVQEQRALLAAPTGL
jgi:hypothetical protein